MDKHYSLALKIIFTILLIVGMVWFLNQVLWVVNLLIISVLVVYTISPSVTFLTEKKIPHWLAVAIVYLAFLAVIALLFYLVIPILINEIVELAQILPRYSVIIEPVIFDLIQFIQSPQFEEVLINLIQQIPSNLQQVLNQAAAITFTVFSRLSDILIILFLVFYLLKDLTKIKRGIVNAVPLPYRKETARILAVLNDKVGKYLRGNLLRCGIVGLFTGIGLLIMGIPFYFILGVFAGVMNIIYYIGPYIAAFPAVLISLSPDTPGPLVIIIFYILVQALDAFVLTPLLLGKTVDIQPFTTIVAILIGGKLLGVLGIILAIPCAATIKVVYNIYFNEKNSSNNNNDHIKNSPSPPSLPPDRQL